MITLILLTVPRRSTNACSMSSSDGGHDSESSFRWTCSVTLRLNEDLIISEYTMSDTVVSIAKSMSAGMMFIRRELVQRNSHFPAQFLSILRSVSVIPLSVRLHCVPGCCLVMFCSVTQTTIAIASAPSTCQ